MTLTALDDKRRVTVMYATIKTTRPPVINRTDRVFEQHQSYDELCNHSEESLSDNIDSMRHPKTTLQKISTAALWLVSLVVALLMIVCGALLLVVFTGDKIPYPEHHVHAFIAMMLSYLVLIVMAVINTHVQSSTHNECDIDDATDEDDVVVDVVDLYGLLKKGSTEK